MTDKQVATKGAAEVERSEREPEFVLRPPVDIFEDAEGITLQLDMPGVAKDRLDIQADRNSLVIEGRGAIDMPQGMEALYAEVRSTGFRRSFALSSELEPEKIDANLKDGVLTLRIPRRAELRPRKIEVR
ncbi:MAG: Hsp20/alpha crystallin family protein [Burkholderiales bacterium]|nr:Hsp20/alpha crystallin family protein [Burkholderiales bacterium]